MPSIDDRRQFRSWLRALPHDLRPRQEQEIASMQRLVGLLQSDFGPQWPRPLRLRDNILGPMRCLWLRQIAKAGFVQTEQYLCGWLQLHQLADYLLVLHWEHRVNTPMAIRNDFFALARAATSP